MKDTEYRLLDAIARDATVTQAGLATRLDMAVGSVNRYIKRLIGKGYLKVTRMERTRLKYHLTPQGMLALTRRTTEYVERSLQVYRDLRGAALRTTDELQQRGIQRVVLVGNSDPIDILRLTCIEHGIIVDGGAATWAVRSVGSGYEIVRGGEGVNHARSNT